MAEDYAEELIDNKNKTKIYKYNEEILGSSIYLSDSKPKQPRRIIEDWSRCLKTYTGTY